MNTFSTSTNVQVCKLRQTIVANRVHFTLKQTTWSRRLLNYLRDNGYYLKFYLPVDDYIEFLRSLSLVAHKQEVYHAVKLFQLSGCPVNEFQLHN